MVLGVDQQEEKMSTKEEMMIIMVMMMGAAEDSLTRFRCRTAIIQAQLGTPKPGPSI
jgi:hypothetical protein